MLGWIASGESAASQVSIFFHVLPPSFDASKCTRQFGLSLLFSVLDGQRMVPSANSTGLFLIGPRKPSGRRRASLQVLPSSVLVRNMPHQDLGSGPTL